MIALKRYGCAKHGRKGEVFFWSVSDNDQRWSHDVAESPQPHEARDADEQRHGGGGPLRSSVMIQSCPNAAPVIYAPFKTIITDYFMTTTASEAYTRFQISFCLPIKSAHKYSEAPKVNCDPLLLRIQNLTQLGASKRATEFDYLITNADEYFKVNKSDIRCMYGKCASMFVLDA